MSKNLPQTSATACNHPAVSAITVIDTSDRMPFCDEDADEFDLDDLLEEPDHPAYCSQNHGDCNTCSLVNYGRDCMNNPVIDYFVEVQP